MTLPRVLAQHGYLLEWQERRGGTYYFETQWKTRAPFEDERVLGAEYARTQVRFYAQPRDRLYSVRIEVDNVLGTNSGDWAQAPRTEMFGRYARRIATDVRSELSTGMRTF